MASDKRCLSFNGFLKLDYIILNKSVFLHRTYTQGEVYFSAVFGKFHPPHTSLMRRRQGIQILIKNLVP